MHVAAFIGELQHYKNFKPSYLSTGKWAISPFLSDQVTIEVQLHLHQLFYLQYYVSRLQTTSKVSHHFKHFLVTFILAQLYQASLTMGGGGGGRLARVCMKQNELRRCKGKIGLVMAYNWLRQRQMNTTVHYLSPQDFTETHSSLLDIHGIMKAPDYSYGLP